MCIMDDIENHFPAKMHYIAGFCLYDLNILLGMIPPDPCRSAFGAWTQIPICARLARVPSVPVLRNGN